MFDTNDGTIDGARTVSELSDAERDGLSVDDRHRILSRERRRIALSVLAHGPTPTNLDRLAASVAHCEGTGDAEGESDAVALALHHVHLPLLDDLGVVDYAPDSRVVDASEDRLDELVGSPSHPSP